METSLKDPVDSGWLVVPRSTKCPYSLEKKQSLSGAGKNAGVCGEEWGAHAPHGITRNRSSLRRRGL